MATDVIPVEEHHRNAARAIAERLLPKIKGRRGRYTVTVGGESGSGKTETAKALAEELERRGCAARIYQQDDYFLLPPKSNDAKRRKDISSIGTGEVRLELMDRHLKAARQGRRRVNKPLVAVEADRIDEETVDLGGIRVVIAEGTYTTLLKQVDTKIFIDRSQFETGEHPRWGGKGSDPFIKDVLEIEHHIVAPHKLAADVLITKEFHVRFRE